MQRVLMGISLLASFVLSTSVLAQSAPPVARDKGAEDIVAKLLLRLLSDRQLSAPSRYQPSLLSEGVCSSAIKGAWVKMMETDEGPMGAFYETSSVDDPSEELRKLVERGDWDARRWGRKRSRFAVAVWKRGAQDSSTDYWVGVVLAKSAFPEWAGLHFGADTPGEMISPNADAKAAVIPQCRHK